MKQAILVVSFGTSYHETLEKTIGATERAIQTVFPQVPVYRAFTSNMICKKLLERDGIAIDSVTQAMERLVQAEVTHVAVQSTHVMHGEEYEKLSAALEPYREKIQISMGMPLLHSMEDYETAADALLNWLPVPEEGQALVLMGHGTEHFANASYVQLEHILRRKNDRIWIGTVEGYPTLEEIKAQLAEQPAIRQITLAPFMLVAGDHARNDMAGEEDSWKNQLEELGYEVTCLIQGLGECPAMRDIFVSHCRQAMEELDGCIGTLTGVGVGPGDPELMTLKAVRALKEADVIFVPDPAKSEKTAFQIAQQYLTGKTLRFVTTPMLRDRTQVEQSYVECAREICQLLDQGKQVAYITLGDPSIYSTYFYVHEKVAAQGYPTQIVPGVPSFCAAAARLNRSLCQGKEQLLIVPASHGNDDALSYPANKVFMKSGKSVMALQEALRKQGTLEGASLVENCGLTGERILPQFGDLTEPSGYFSLVIAKGVHE